MYINENPRGIGCGGFAMLLSAQEEDAFTMALT